MYISVQPSHIDVLEPTDYRRFDLQADAGLSAVDIGAQLQSERLGDVEDGHAWIRIDQLRTRLASSSDFDAKQFSAMVAYAVEHEWVSPDGEAIRAHIRFGDQH